MPPSSAGPAPTHKHPPKNTTAPPLTANAMAPRPLPSPATVEKSAGTASGIGFLSSWSNHVRHYSLGPAPTGLPVL